MRRLRATQGGAVSQASTLFNVRPVGHSGLRRFLRSVARHGRIIGGAGSLMIILGACVLSLFWTLDDEHPAYYDSMFMLDTELPPSLEQPAKYFGTDDQGRSLLGRCLVGGTVSVAVGLAAAFISVVLGVSVGLVAGYKGGWVDAILMRIVDVMYGLPYILMVIVLKIAFEDALDGVFASRASANLVILFIAIGLVSWLTMARVVRGQVLSLRSQPFIEAARAIGVPERRIFLRHLLPNLVGPITVYATLTIPRAILEESFLSFLGIGIASPMTTWGSLASEGMEPAFVGRWWMLLFPCTLLALTLLSLNFLGDGLRDLFDPKKEGAKI